MQSASTHELGHRKTEAREHRQRRCGPTRHALRQNQGPAQVAAHACPPVDQLVHSLGVHRGTTADAARRTMARGLEAKMGEGRLNRKPKGCHLEIERDCFGNNPADQRW